MKCVSRKLSNLIRLTEQPYTDRIYKILHKEKSDEFNKNYIINTLAEPLIDNRLYSLKIDFAFSNCDTVLSTVVNQVSVRTFDEIMSRMIRSNIEHLEAINIDFYKCENPKVSNFTEDKYLGSFMFIVA